MKVPYSESGPWFIEVSIAYSDWSPWSQAHVFHTTSYLTLLAEE